MVGHWPKIQEQRARWTRRHLLGLEELSRDEILGALETAALFKKIPDDEIRQIAPLRGRRVFNFFAEPSTRTKTSFSLAARRLGAETIDFSPSTSSLTKGETLADTARTLEALGVDYVVMRHADSGAPYHLTKLLRAAVLNAGDGAHEHPTQGLLDLLTIREAFGRIEGLHVALVGDIAYSRVARSDLHGLIKLGNRVTVVGPPTLLPAGIESLGVAVAHQFDAVIPECDVIVLLRLQLERQQAGLFPSVQEYIRLYGMNEARLGAARKDVLIMHPGPMNRGIEVTSAVADGERSAILRQVTNGLAVRQAALYLLSDR